MDGGVMFSEMPFYGYPLWERLAPTHESYIPRTHGIGRPSSSERFERKRKLDGFKAEPMGDRVHQNAGDDYKTARNGGGRTIFSIPVRESHVSTPDEKVQPAPKRVISIPVVSADDTKDRSVKCTIVPEEKTKNSRKNSRKSALMSTDRAATLLQSWYRGHLVRRTKPLVQLRRIQEVNSRLRELQAQISNGDCIQKSEQDPRAKVWLIESLMNLLFKLDAIQGSNPFVRELRKAATREVIGCQDSVEALLSRKEPSTLEEETPVDGGESDDQDAAIPDTEETEPLVNDLNSISRTTEGEAKENQIASSGEATSTDSILEGSKVYDDDNEIVTELDDDSRTKRIEPDPDQTSSGNGGGGEQELRLQPLSTERTSAAIVMEKTTNGESEAVPPAEEKIFGREIGINQLDLQERHTESLEARAAKTDDAMRTNTTETLCSTGGNRSGDDQRLESTIAPEEGIGSQIESDDCACEMHDDFQSECASDITEELGLGEVCVPNGLSKPKFVTGSAGYEIQKDRRTQEAIHLKEFPTAGSPISPLDVISNNEPGLPTSMEGAPTPGVNECAYSKLSEEVECEKRSQDLLTKLSLENQALKSLIVSLMQWNQVQATTMQDVNQRLIKLERRVLSHRTQANKQQNGARRRSCTRRVL
ncbi:unnamed protein product [Calypogeia fissa]